MKSISENIILRSSSVGHSLTECNYLEYHYKAGETQFDIMLYSAGFKKGWKILDAGTGSGSYIPSLSRILGEEGCIYAIDIAPENIDYVQAKIQKDKLNCKIYPEVGNILSLNHKNNSFDAIWCSNVFQYLTESEKKKTLKEFYRIVKPGGIVVIKELDLSSSNICNDKTIFQSIIKKMGRSIQVKSTLKTQNISHIASKLGLKLEACKTFFIEWQYPIEPYQLPYLNAISQFFGSSALKLELTNKESSVISRYVNPHSKEYFITSPDFFWNEAYNVAVFSVPYR